MRNRRPRRALARHLVSPTIPAVTSVADSQSVLAELEAADRLLVQQVFKPIANEYRISVPSPGSTEEGGRCST